jgi:C1A family cysteine protease
MATYEALDLHALRAQLQEQGASWRSVDTNIAMLEEKARRRLLGVPLPDDAEVERIESQAAALANAATAVSDGAGGVGASFDARTSGYVTPVKNQAAAARAWR